MVKWKLKQRMLSKRIMSMILALCLLVGSVPVLASDAMPTAASTDLIYNFKKAFVAGATGYDYVPKITYAMTTKDDSAEINPNIPSEPWAFFSTTATGGNSYFKYNTDAYGLALSYANTGSVKIRVNNSGIYLPKARMYTATNCPVTIAVYKYDAIKNAQGEKLVEKTFTTSGTDDYAISDKPIEMTEGEYIVSISITEDEGLAIIDGFKLINFSDKLTVAAPAISLLSRQNAKSIISVMDPIGNAVNISNLQYTIKVSDPTIASASIAPSDDKLELNVQGLNGGQCRVTVDISSNDGKTGQVVVPVTVQADFIYNFKKAFVAGATGYDYVPKITYAMTTKGDSAEINPAIQSEPWAFFNTTATGGNSYFKYNCDYYGLALSYANTGSVKINVPTSGIYLPEARMYTATRSPVTIALYKYDSVNNSQGDKLVEKTFSTSGTDDYVISDKPIEMTAGEYIVSISITEDEGLAIIDGFKLIDYSNKLTVTAPAISVMSKQSVKNIISVLDPLGKPVNISNLQNTVKVSDPAICSASVTASTDKLELTVQALTAGQCSVTVDVSSNDGKNGQVVVPVTVKSDFDVNIVLDIPDRVKKGETVAVPALVKYVRNGIGDSDAPAEITLKPSTTGILTATVTEGTNKINNTVNLEGVSTGSIALDVEVKVQDIVKKFKYAIMVYDLDITSSKDYKYMIQKCVTEQADLSVCTNYLKTIKASDEQLRPGSETDTWCYVGQSEGSIFKYLYDSYGSYLASSKVGAWGSIKIRVPESGIYQTVSQNALYPMAGIMRVYLAPADAENPRDPQYSLGTKDTFIKGDNTTIIPVHLSQLRTVALEAGDYILTWENIGRNPDALIPSPNLYIGGFMLNATSYPKITLSTDAVPAFKRFTTVEVPLNATVSDGTDEDLYGADITATPKDAAIASAKIVKRDNKTYVAVTGIGVGKTDIDLSIKIRGTQRATLSVPINVLEAGKLTRVTVGVAGSESNTISLHQTNMEKNQAQIDVHIYDENNEEIPVGSAAIQNVTYSYESLNSNIATVNNTGLVYAFAPGKVIMRVTVTMSGVTMTGEAELNVTLGKTVSTYYTPERVSAARENANLYPWAKKIKEEAIQKADKFLNNEELLWNSVTTQELPRSYFVGYRADPEATKCRYCGCDIAAKYGSPYGWLRDAYKDPWKIQCPDCRRKFPSNDFGEFYDLGIDEHGNWRYELAKERNAQLVAEGKDGYLKNILYPEKDVDGITNWGVDDSYGYKTGRKYSNGCEEVHTYISCYNHWAIWNGGMISSAVEALADAYIYTGDARYGRTGAILIDRIADIYPDMDTAPYVNQFTTGWYTPHGKIIDLIWECGHAQAWTRAYDAFYPMYEDPQVISFLAKKAEKYKLTNNKSSASLIRTNCEDGILREIFKSAKIGNLNGNFGTHQAVVALAGVVLDSMPESREMIDWVFQNGEEIGTPQATEVTGGNVNRQLLTQVDRDGVSNEVSPGYSDLWITGLSRIVEALDGYKGYPEMDLYNNPRFIKMMSYQLSLIMSRYSTVQIGDTGATADNSQKLGVYRLIPAFKSTKKPLFAQSLYFSNGNSADGLHYDIFTKNPNLLEQDVREVINKYGEYNFDKSEQLCGYGLAALRGGSLYPSSGTNDDVDTQRTFWMFYGRGAGHGHDDSLNLGIEALGLNIAPELGYPRNTTADDYLNWGQSTVAHNTVEVNDAAQNRNLTAGKPMHFDDSGRVKLMDADCAHQYGIDIYRRSVVTVDVNNEISYGIDFFRVKGGDQHVYSFHALSDTIAATEGLNNLVPQKDTNGNYIGSYAGPNIPYGTTGHRSGYAWIKNVNRAANVSGGNFMVDFKITDFRKKLKNPQDTHLRMTMLNGFDLSEVAIADGCPPPVYGNPEKLKFVLARRSGSNLDTLFTTVLEPYNNERYISKIEAVSNVKHADGSAIASGEVVRAVKVTLVDGRTDYVVYAADNGIEYRVDDLFNIRGFIGVYTLKDGAEIYSYVNDGDKIGDTIGVGCYTGSVVDFTKELSSKNSITVKMDGAVDIEKLIGQYIYINKTGTGNAAYLIKNASAGADNQVVLDIADVTLIDGMANDGSYIYNIGAGQTFRIPLSVLNDTSPIFNVVDNQRAEAGREFKLSVHATSPADRPIRYYASSLPRGANFDESTAQITWSPDSHQIGSHHVAITATDGKLESTINFVIQVYSATNRPSPQPPIIEDSDKDKDKEQGKDNDKDKDNDKNKEQEQSEPPEATKHFEDLGGYDWAKDAIVKLAEDGIIKGTSETTFNPGSDITRADFAILVVRALKLEAKTEGNFSDVSQDDYFAAELAVAKASGIITGSGDNQFNPRGKITREDMMTIMARALEKAGYALNKPDQSALGSFADKNDISNYALSAAATLVQNGIIAGSNGKLNPKANTTRAEVAVLINRVLNEQSK